MNSIDMLNQKDVALLEYIHSYPSTSQRTIAGSMGMSLGQANALINKLINSGDIEALRRNGRQTEYVVTKRGEMRRMRHSAIRLTQSFRHVIAVKRTIGELLDNLLKEGVKEFILEGNDETVASIVGEVFREVAGEKAKLIWGPTSVKKDQVILKLDGVDGSPKDGVVYILKELANAG